MLAVLSMASLGVQLGLLSGKKLREEKVKLFNCMI